MIIGILQEERDSPPGLPGTARMTPPGHVAANVMV
jgi:hypothetical protein